VDSEVLVGLNGTLQQYDQVQYFNNDGSLFFSETTRERAHKCALSLEAALGIYILWSPTVVFPNACQVSA
jgi:hypothetical protein